jgi:hypothetical protein
MKRYPYASPIFASVVGWRSEFPRACAINHCEYAQGGLSHDGFDREDIQLCGQEAIVFPRPITPLLVRSSRISRRWGQTAGVFLSHPLLLRLCKS